MATALALEKPLLGQKMPWSGSRLENRSLSRRMHREKCRPLVRSASGAPVFANGAVTAAMGYAFGSLASRSSSDNAFVSGGEPGQISVEEARAQFNDVIEALSMVGVDTSGIHFDEGYGIRMNGEYRSITDYDDFRRLAGSTGAVAVGGKHSWVTEPGPWWKLGFGSQRHSHITIYRNAFSTPIYNVPLPTGTWPANLPAGFQAGVFLLGHEIGHRTTSNEAMANRAGQNTYRRVCAGDPRC